MFFGSCRLCGRPIIIALLALTGIGLCLVPVDNSVDLIDLWRDVDAVAHLKISQSTGARPAPGTGCGRCYEHEAKIMEVFRLHFGGPKQSARLLQPAVPCDAAVGSSPPYQPGEEFVAFLRWNVAEKAFLSYLMVPVRNGEVKSPYIKEIEKGTKLEPFLIKLRTMME